MAADFQKLVKEPLLWVGAAVLCVPLLGSGFLNNLRERITFGEAYNVNSEFAEEGTEIALGVTSEDSIKTDWMKPAEEASPEMPAMTSRDEAETPEGLEAELLESSIASLPTAKPGISSTLDPGSLLPEADLYGQKDLDEKESRQKESRQIKDAEVESKAIESGAGLQDDLEEPESPELDFLFGDESEMEQSEEPKIEQPPIDDPKLEQPPLDQLQSEEPQIAETEETSSLPPMVQNESEPFEFPSAGNSYEAFSPSQTSNRGFQEWQSPSVEPEVATPLEFFGQPQQVHVEPVTNDYFLEIDAGPDWWTPYCQQPFWGAIPTQQTGLDAVVFSALQNSPFVKLINTEPQMAQTVVTELDARFDWSAFVETNWSDTDRPVVSLLDTGTAGGRFVQQQLLFESGVKKNLRSGGHLRVGHAWQRTDNNSAFLSPPDQATAQLLLDYRQPLLKGAGKHVNNSQVVLAQIGVETAQNETQALLQQFLVDVVAEYWELHYARGVLVQKMRAAERAEQLFHEISSFDDAQKWQRDMIRVQAAATARRTDLIRAQNMVATHQETLMNLTYGTSMPDPSSMEIVPMEAPGTFMVPYNLGQVTEMAVQNRPEVQVALTAIRASAIRQNLVLNDLKPRLDAIVSTFISGVDENKDVGGAFSNATDYNPSYAVGFSFEVPLGRRAANSRLHRQQLDYQRLQHQLEQTLGNVRLDARLAYRGVQSLSNELENHKLAAQQAAQELQAVTQRTAAGLSGDSKNASLLIADLLQSQARLGVAEERLLRSQTDLSVALVRLKRATGQLLQTAPMPQVSDHAVQQASFEQPSTEQLWAAPSTQQTQTHSVLESDLWADHSR